MEHWPLALGSQLSVSLQLEPSGMVAQTLFGELPQGLLCILYITG
jgi:hypothetical protein